MRRCLLFALGAATLAFAWLLPLETFSAHMATHMAVVALAAPLLSFAVAGTKLDPVLRAPELFPPVPLSVVELVVVWLWHTPFFHHAARHDRAVFVGEQATFLLSGLLVWLSAFGGERDDPRRTGPGLVALLLTSMHMTLLGALLALPPRPLLSHGGDLEDQHMGGAVMLIAGGVSYLAGGLWLAARLLRPKRKVSDA